MERTERFGLVLSPTEKLYLKRLAEHERISRASVIRRLLWREAQRLLTHADQPDARADRVDDVDHFNAADGIAQLA